MKNALWKVLHEVAERSSFSPKLANWRDMWPTFCDPPFDRVSLPCALADGVLYIDVEVRWREEFERVLPSISEKICSFPWGVTSVEIFDPQKRKYSAGNDGNNEKLS